MVTSWLILVLYSLIQGYICADFKYYGELYGERNYITYCLNSKEPIQLKDPFPIAERRNDEFHSMSWFFNTFNGSVYGRIEVLMLVTFSFEFRFYSKRHKLYQNWGIQIPYPQPSDAGQYTAFFTTIDGAFQKITHVTSTEPPTLQTLSLREFRMVSIEGGNWTLKCGKLTSVGEPPVDIYWLARNGSIIPGIYRDGYFILFLNEDEDPWGFKCRVNDSSPAIQCIPKKDRKLWKLDNEIEANIKPFANLLMKLLLIIISFNVFLVVLVVSVYVTYKIYYKRNSTQTQE